MLDLGSHNNHQFGYHYVSADRRLCLFHALVFLFNDTDALLDRRQSVQAPKPWTVDTLLNFFFFDVLPWVEIAAPNLLAHLLSRVGLQSIEKYRCTSLTLTLMTSVSNHTPSSPCLRSTLMVSSSYSDASSHLSVSSLCLTLPSCPLFSRPLRLAPHLAPPSRYSASSLFFQSLSHLHVLTYVAPPPSFPFMPLRLAPLLAPMSGPSVSPLRQAPLPLTPSYCPSGPPLCLAGRLASPSRPSISPPPSSPSFPPVVLPLRLAPGLAPSSRPSISPLRLSLWSLPSVCPESHPYV